MCVRISAYLRVFNTRPNSIVNFDGNEMALTLQECDKNRRLEFARVEKKQKGGLWRVLWLIN